MDILEITGRHKLLTAIEIQNEKDAKPLGKALMIGGLTVAEVTFRTPAAVEAVRNLVQSQPDMIIGAGSIVQIDQAKEAISAGARFIVSAGYSQELVDWCINQHVPVLPGVATASEITMALMHGLEVLKFFPAEVMGGINGIKALSAPFPTIKFIPMGGISSDNLGDYLKLPSVHACGGTWLANRKLIAEGKFDEITRLTHEALMIVQEVRKKN